MGLPEVSKRYSGMMPGEENGVTSVASTYTVPYKPPSYYTRLNNIVWKPPEKGTIKLNFDGGYSHMLQCGISAGMFRDNDGAPLLSYANFHGISPYDGESGALLNGLLLAQNLGYKKLWVEGDAKYLIQVIYGEIVNQWYNVDTVKKIREAMKQFEITPKLTFMYREANKAADALVKLLHNDFLETPAPIWIGENLPSHILDIIIHERHGCTYTRETHCH